MKYFLIFALIFVSFASFGQDERQFRALFSAELNKDISKESVQSYKYEVNTPLYKIDLNSDHRKESVFFESKDGESWIHILGYDLKRIKSFKFETNGYGANLYKIRIKNLSDTTLVLVLYFYEGLTKYTELNSTSRLYFLTVDQNSLDTVSFKKGPVFWEEKRTLQGHYHQRPNFLSFVDLNKNGTREIIVKQGSSSSVYMYNGEGHWIDF